MKKRNFQQMLENQWSCGNFVCVGLDSDDSDRMCAIVDATHDLVCAYKPNIAFYEKYGNAGWIALRDTIAYVYEVAQDVPVILDAKRGDIGNTNLCYVEMAFDFFQVDAITVHPYLGAEALQPFFEQTDKGIFVLCRTSNPGAGEFQDIKVITSPEEERQWGFSGDEPNTVSLKLFEYVAYHVAYNWNKNGNCGVVVGAANPEELKKVRGIVGDIPILIPGIGVQGGDVEKTVTAGKDSRGQGFIINSSRGIIFASNGEDFVEAARLETEKLRNLINQHR